MLDGLAWINGPALPAALGNVAALNTFVGVLMAGGATTAAGTTTPRGAYIFDPTDPTATSWTTDLSIDRGRNAAGIGATGSFGPAGNDGSKYLSDVMLFGGANAGTATATVMNYNLYHVTDTGDAGTPPSMSTERFKFAYATDPATGDLYAIGGLNSTNHALASVERYNPAADAWEPVAALPQALYGASAVTDGAGHILMFGGDNSAGTPVRTVYSYTIATGTWSSAVDMPGAASGTAAVFGAYGQIYVIGGLAASGPVDSVNVYNPVTDAWTSDAPLPAAEYGAAAVIDSAGNLDVIGGFNVAGSAVSTMYQSATLPAPVGLPAVPTVQLYAQALYNGQAQSAFAWAVGSDGVTQIDGRFSFTYNGSPTPPTNAGTYKLVATFTSKNPNYVNTIATGTMQIDPATPTLAVSGGGTIKYDGLPHPISATVLGVDGVTLVSGNLVITYNGSSNAPINPGTYTALAVFASSDPNYTDASASLTSTIPDPTIPTGVTVKGASTSSVRISWNPVRGAAYYNVYERHVLHSPRGSLATITWSLLAGSVTGTSIVVGGSSGTFRLTSVSASGIESPPSALASGSALSAPYLANFLLGGAVMSSANVQIGQTLQITLLGYGNEAPAYTLVSGPATMSVDGATGIVTYKPVAGEVGTVFATFTASNSVGSSSATFSFQVGPSLVPGDWNQDGKFDENDLPAMLAATVNLAAYQASTGLTDAQFLTVGDANGDGAISNADIQALINAIIAVASGAGSSATNAAVATLHTTAVQEGSDVAAAVTTSVFVADSAQGQTTGDSVLSPTNLSPPPHLIVDSFVETQSTISPPSNSSKAKGNGEANHTSPGRPRSAPSAVDQILSASPWRGIGNHARKVHLLAYGNAEYDGIIESNS
jgi:hypothetical protein